jgi:hypothetical protein
MIGFETIGRKDFSSEFFDSTWHFLYQEMGTGAAGSARPAVGAERHG